VDELFAPPGPAWQPVSPALARMRHTVLAVVAGLLLVAALVAGLLAPVPLWIPVAVALLVVVGAAGAWRYVTRNAARWGYAEREEDLYVRHGALVRKLVVVPYGRMQYVDVQAGPLDRVYGIAAVHLHTASPGTSARIPGLAAADAARLRDRLTALGEAQAAGL
jgi:membrane protein YdbS with pleckstrin-like domain